MASAWSLSACFNGASSDDAINASSSASDLIFARSGRSGALSPAIELAHSRATSARIGLEQERYLYLDGRCGLIYQMDFLY